LLDDQMRAALGFVVVGALWAGGASASSFVVLPAMEARVGPSMIVLGAPGSPSTDVASMPEDAVKPDQTLEVPPGESLRLSTSVIAVGEPDVGLDKVAAIASQAKSSRPEAPIVIRGGVVGDAFAPAAPSEPVTVTPGAAPQATAQAPKSKRPAPREGVPGAEPAPAQPAPAAKKPE
jgi:hypothetical protein